MAMDADHYQNQARTTAQYPGKGEWIGLVYTMLGLGEAGELQGKAKKIIRDDNFIVTEERRQAMIDELGDVQWYVSQAASELGVPLSKIMRRNLDKLFDRRDRGVIGGSGDNR